MIGPKAEVIGFVMPCLDGHPVGVVLVAGKARPAPLPDGKQFADQQAAHLAMLLLAQDMFDLPMGLGVVRSVLHQVQLI